MAKSPKRHLRAVADSIDTAAVRPDEVSLDTSAFNAIPDEDALEALLDEVGDEEFGEVALKDAKPVKLKEWKAEEFASIYIRFRPHLERHARKFLTNRSQIDEVVQDAFLYLMVSLPELDSEIGVLRFLKWKVKNLCIDVYRAQGRAYINNIDDIAEPASNDAEVGSHLEAADDAAIVKLAMSKLNPRHREVLVASIYEEKSTAEIAAQVGLSENATLQLLYRARGAFKKALLGDVDTEGMSMAAILSVAARKAGEEAKKVGVQAMVLVLFLALGIGALFNFNRGSQTNVAAEPQQTVAPIDSPSQPDANVTPVKQGAAATSTTVTAHTAAAVKEVPQVEDFYQQNPIKSATAASIATANSSAEVTVYRSSKTDSSQYAIQGENGLSATFTYAGGTVSNLIFHVNADGIAYSAYALNVQVQALGNYEFAVVGLTSDLIDLNNLVYTGNALAKASFALNMTLTDGASTGHLVLISTN
ncbi:MAG: sigma-70 family RNA polymerase sigma factor [Micrococcales bacterium]